MTRLGVIRFSKTVLRVMVKGIFFSSFNIVVVMVVGALMV